MDVSRFIDKSGKKEHQLNIAFDEESWSLVKELESLGLKKTEFAREVLLSAFRETLAKLKGNGPQAA